jgi:hypothetical protein
MNRHTATIAAAQRKLAVFHPQHGGLLLRFEKCGNACGPGIVAVWRFKSWLDASR